MPDPRFHTAQARLTLAEVAAITAARLEPATAAAQTVAGVATLAAATADDLAYVDGKKWRGELAATVAGAVLVPQDLLIDVPPTTAALVVDQPQLAYIRIARAFYPERAATGIHPSAIVDATATIDADVEIGAGTVIGARVTIGSGTRIGAATVIEAGVAIGRAARIGPHVTISHAVLGDRVVVKPGARIGQAGFGFAVVPTGFERIPQLGMVVIGDDVEIGANTTIDRGALGDTTIGAGTMIDNLVQIAHNCRIGHHAVVVAQVEGARVAAQAGVMRDVPDGEAVGGAPAVSMRQWHRQTVAITRLTKS